MEKDTDRLTLVVHTAAVAAKVKMTLEAHGIAVASRPVDVPGMKEGAVALEVAPSALADALKVTESGLRVSVDEEELKMAGMSGTVLIPVDFSDLTLTEIRVGFDLARRLGLSAVVLHAYPASIFPTTPPAQPFAGDFDQENSLETIQQDELFDEHATHTMRELSDKITSLIAKGEVSDVKFSCEVRPGVPEEVIREYTRLTPPELVVMATRGAARSERNIMGSVTAEVLDSCRVPVFTVPETCRFDKVESIRKLAFFCNLDRQDVMSVDFLMSMFGYPDVEIVLVPVAEKGRNRDHARLEAFRQYLAGNYPEAEFSVFYLQEKDARGSFEQFLHESGVELLIVPNKKKNIFARLFNPGIPHKILFERDIPMLALPV
ncbi:MAG: universal stress protein [Muribaculaceae bacterium]|nr:universal stress protein [Muribaculaceae bacterium]